MYWPAVTDSRNRSARFSSCERTNAKYTVLAFCIVWRFPTQPEFRTYTAARNDPRSSARSYILQITLPGILVRCSRRIAASSQYVRLARVRVLAPFFLITGENGVSKTRAHTHTLGPGARTSGPTAAPHCHLRRGGGSGGVRVAVRGAGLEEACGINHILCTCGNHHSSSFIYKFDFKHSVCGSARAWSRGRCVIQREWRPALARCVCVCVLVVVVIASKPPAVKGK